MAAHDITKKLLFSLLAFVGLIAAGTLTIRLAHPKPTAPDSLTLPDGSVVRITAVTYGTHHVVGSLLARWTARMPSVIRKGMVKVFGSLAVVHNSATTPNPTLAIWLERTTNNASQLADRGYLSAFLSDATGFASGEAVSLYPYDWLVRPKPLHFQAFPRRERFLTLNFLYHTPAGSVNKCGSLTVANPRRGFFRDWKPETLPSTKRAGDVEFTLTKVSTGYNRNTSHKTVTGGGRVNWKPETLPSTKRVGDVEFTLTKVSTGHNQNISHKSVTGGGRVIEFGANRVDARNTTVCFYDYVSLTDTNQRWAVTSVKISDATGNKLRSTSTGRGSDEEKYFTFHPGLWTNEPSWKLNCEIKRTKGFSPGETFTFKNVPLGALGITNFLGWSTNFADISVTLAHLIRRAPNKSESWSSDDLSHAHFTVNGATNGLHLDLLTARSDNGTTLVCPSSGSSDSYRDYNFRNIPLEAKTVDITFAVHRSRWVEFTVKPDVGVARLELKPPGGK